MKKLKSIGMMILLVLVATWTIACNSGKEEGVIEEFLTCWLQNSTANAKLQHLMMEGAAVIGMGTEEAADEEMAIREENAEAFDQLFEETYGKYMTDDALETFKSEQYSVCSMLLHEGDSWEISKIDVQEESESYRFEAEIVIDNNEEQRTVVQGRIRMEDGVISELSDL